MTDSNPSKLGDNLNSLLEEHYVEYWNKVKIYDIQKKKPYDDIYRFMDGPPFVSSKTLHYGHLLVGYAKRIVNMFMNMNNKKVLNKFGYDCHGLPIEMEVNKLLGIKSNMDVYAIGVDVYNATCSETVDSYSGSWKPHYNRIARWTDNDQYMTKDFNFMESCMWAFKQLYDKQLAYSGYNVVAYSVACNTSLSNFEAKLNYKERDDPSLYLKFPLVNEDNTYFTAWTTTPWTVPSHLALAVHPTMKYIKIVDKKTNEKFYIAENNVTNLYKNKKDYDVIDTFTGSELVGLEYKQPFPYFENWRSKGAFRVYADNFVKITDDSDDKKKPIGTGIVHCAPAFGADDFNMCTKHFISPRDIGSVCPIDENGKFTNQIPDYAGQYAFDFDKHPSAYGDKAPPPSSPNANEQIARDLKTMGYVIRKETYRHMYPYCWRTDTPLMYVAQRSFFVAVTSIRDRMVELNKTIHWEPDYVGKKRFEEWLKEAKDWGVSRSRFFGTPIPVWVSDDWEEMVVIGSVDELVEKAGLIERPMDLHSQFLNKITIPSKQGKGLLHRVPDVFDCWFESGSVPFAQFHYPMENKDIFKDQEFLSDFICEGIDQTRGWFYTLLVLSTALFDKAPFKNCISTGLILASDGKKMSKRLMNYPETSVILDKYGSDALGLYLTNSPAIRGESLKFNEADVWETKKPLNQWFNALKFFTSHLKNYTKSHLFNSKAYLKTENFMDKWIMSELGSLINHIHTEMANYKLYTILPKFVQFIENMTNWYLKFNRDRLKGDVNREEWETSLSTLYNVLLIFSKVSAPFTPFLAEYMYDNLKHLNNEDNISIHMCDYPPIGSFPIDLNVERKMALLQDLSTIVRNMRHTYDSKAPATDLLKFTTSRTPINTLHLLSDDDSILKDISDINEYFISELNCLNIKLGDLGNMVEYVVTPNHKSIGLDFRDRAKDIKKFLESIPQSDIDLLRNNEEINYGSFVITKDHVVISERLNNNYNNTYNGDNYCSQLHKNILIVADFKINEDVAKVYNYRNVNSHIQQMRKDANLEPIDNILIYYDTKSKYGKMLLEEHYEDLERKSRATIKQYTQQHGIKSSIDIVNIADPCDDTTITFWLVK